jgi:hypothetical protein
VLALAVILGAGHKHDSHRPLSRVFLGGLLVGACKELVDLRLGTCRRSGGLVRIDRHPKCLFGLGENRHETHE